MLDLKPWTLPLIVAAIAVPVVAGFFVAGPGLGLAVGFAACAAIVVVAARLRPRGPIETATAASDRRHVLVVLGHELDDPAAIDRLAAGGTFGRPEDDVEVLVLAPARSRLLDRWTSDVAAARAEAGRKLVISVASLAKAGVAAGATLGDHDVVQAVEDLLRSFPADEVILVTRPAVEDPDADRAAAELGARLRQPLSRIVIDDAAGSGLEPASNGDSR